MVGGGFFVKYTGWGLGFCWTCASRSGAQWRMLPAKHDIVDTVKCTELQGKPFSEQVYSGLAS